MSKVVMYYSPSCPYCAGAEALLKKKGVTFEKLDVDADPGLWDYVYDTLDRETVPQIIIGDRHVGGYDDLAELDAMGELDDLLTADDQGY